MKSALLAIGLTAIVGLAYWLWTPDHDRAWLESRYLAAPTDMIEVAGQRLHVRDSSPKSMPAVILIHGFGASLHTWEPWARALAAEHRVVRFDLPGSGLSPPDATGDYSDTRTLKLIVALMDQLGIQRASLVGHSIGGRIAWTFAARHPERIDKLVLVSPDGFASPGFSYGRAPDVPASLKLMRYVLPRFVLRMSLAPAFANPEALTETLTDRYFDLMRAPGSRDALLQRMQQTVLVDPVPLLRQIRAPTLLVWGRQDAMIPFANSADYMANLRDARLVPLDGVGHLPQEEAPAASLTAVSEFLRLDSGQATAPTARD